MFKKSLIVLAISALTGLGAEAAVGATPKNCVKGKPCGNACISVNDVCHIGENNGVATKTGGLLSGLKNRIQNRDTATTQDSAEVADQQAMNTTTSGKTCKTGKACGNACISASAVCHADEATTVAKGRKKHSRH